MNGSNFYDTNALSNLLLKKKESDDMDYNDDNFEEELMYTDSDEFIAPTSDAVEHMDSDEDVIDDSLYEESGMDLFSESEDKSSKKKSKKDEDDSEDDSDDDEDDGLMTDESYEDLDSDSVSKKKKSKKDEDDDDSDDDSEDDDDDSDDEDEDDKKSKKKSKKDEDDDDSEDDDDDSDDEDDKKSKKKSKKLNESYIESLLESGVSARNIVPKPYTINESNVRVFSEGGSCVVTEYDVLKLCEHYQFNIDVESALERICEAHDIDMGDLYVVSEASGTQLVDIKEKATKVIDKMGEENPANKVAKNLKKKFKKKKKDFKDRKFLQRF